VVDARNGKIALKSGKDGKLCADEGGSGVNCNRHRLGSWEQFTVQSLSDGKIALKGGRDGKWCADEGNKIKCNRDRVGGWERFTVTVV